MPLRSETETNQPSDFLPVHDKYKPIRWNSSRPVVVRYLTQKMVPVPRGCHIGSNVVTMRRMRMGSFVRVGACVALLTTVLYGCRSEPGRRYTTEQEAALISVAHEAALAQGWILENCIYSVRRGGNGWVVQVDRASGYKGDGEPSIVVDDTFFVDIDAEGRPTRILSHGAVVELPLPAAESHN